jgi:hypothetical protein
LEIGRSVVRVAAEGESAAAPALGDSPLLPQRRSRAPRTRALRILALTHNLDRGGSQLILRERLGELVAAGEAEAVVLSPSDGPCGRASRRSACAAT